MPFTMVVGSDGGQGARAALDVSLGLAERLRGKVYLVYLCDEPFDHPVSGRLRERGEEVTRGAMMAAADDRVRAEAVVADRRRCIASPGAACWYHRLR